MSRRRKLASKRIENVAPVTVRLFPVWELVGLAIILLATMLVYRPAMRGDFLWDDDANVTRSSLQPPGGLYRIWFEFGATQQYYPLLHTAFWIEHRLWGDNPAGYHIISLCWHLISVVLVFLVLKRLKIPGALLGAALFALHPVMVETVAWITEQKNTLSTMFYLGSLLVYLDFDRSRKPRQYLAALLLFVLAILAKSAVVTLPAAMLVIFWWQRGTISWKRDVLPLAPFFLAALLMGIATCVVEWKHVGAVGADFQLTVAQRFLLAGRAVWFYLAKLFWPANLIFIYPRWELDPGQWWQWTYPIAAIAVTVALWVLRNRSRAPLAAWLFFCGTLLPMLGLLNQYLFLYTFVSDHFQYVASLGIIALVSGAIGELLARARPTPRIAGGALCVCVVALLASLSVKQTYMYANRATLFQTTIERNPDCWMAYINLGSTYFRAGDPKTAIAHYQKALEIKPDNAMAENNIGTALANMGQLPQALDHFRAAIRIHPDYADVRRNYGQALLNLGRIPEAIEHLEKSIAVEPNEPVARIHLAMALSEAGRSAEANEHIERARQLAQNNSSFCINLGIGLTQLNKLPEALEQFRIAIKLYPNEFNSHWGLATVLSRTGNTAEAVEHYRTALRMKPNFATAYAGLAEALAATGQLDEAIAVAKRGIEVVRSTGQAAIAGQLEKWLRQHNVEVQPTASPTK